MFVPEWLLGGIVGFVLCFVLFIGFIYLASKRQK